jgi:hypothetical protein
MTEMQFDSSLTSALIACQANPRVEYINARDHSVIRSE